MIKHWKNKDLPKDKTALEKARSGILLTNSADISFMAGQNINLLPAAYLAATDCDGADALVQNSFNAATRVSNKKKCDHREGFTLAAMAMLITDALTPVVSAYGCH